MLSVNEIEKNSKLFIEGLKKRNIENSDALISEILTLYEQKKSCKTQLDNKNLEFNKFTDQIGSFKYKSKSSNIDEEIILLKDKASFLKEKIKSIKLKFIKISEDLGSLLSTIPNIPHTSVPQEKNEIVHQSVMPDFGEDLLPHWDIAKKFDLIDFQRGSKIAGAGFPVFKGKLAKLQRSLITFFLDSAIQEGYEELDIPLLINESSAYGTGQLPDKEGMMYKVFDEDLYLIPTAEVPITNFHRNEILSSTELPKKYVGYSPNFRKEAGSWGSHVRGLNRLHQFYKVEIVQLQRPELSYSTLENICSYVENLLEQLNLPYRKLKLCVEDLGFASAMTYDLEVYSAGQKKWLEVSSISNFESFQANRLNLRFKDKDNINKKVHTLNGSAIALPRIMAALLENNQKETKISIPEILVPYTKFESIELL